MRMQGLMLPTPRNWYRTFSDKSKCRASSIARAVAYVVGAA